MAYVELGRITSTDAGSLSDAGAIGLIPTGALEQHGPHLPMLMDSVHAEALARAVADALPVPTVVTPCVTPGLSEHHIDFPGTVTLSPETFRGVVLAYVEALERLGIDRIAIFSGHGGNFGAIGQIARELGADRGTSVIAFDDLDRFLDVMVEAGRQAGIDPPETDVHAGLLETSVALTLFDEGTVRPYANVEGYTAAEPGWLERLMTDGIKAVSENGVLGSPGAATAEAGEKIFDALVDALATWIAQEFALATQPGR
jgi:creatinine amidohydrolase